MPSNPLAAITAAPTKAAAETSLQRDIFVFGSPSATTLGDPGSAPKIQYATLEPTILSANTTIRVSVNTTTNIQRVTIGNGATIVNLFAVGSGAWQGAFSANVLGLSRTASSVQLTLTAQRGDGQSTSIPIMVSISH